MRWKVGKERERGGERKSNSLILLLSLSSSYISLPFSLLLYIIYSIFSVSISLSSIFLTLSLFYLSLSHIPLMVLIMLIIPSKVRRASGSLAKEKPCTTLSDSKVWNQVRGFLYSKNSYISCSNVIFMFYMHSC